MSFIPDRAKGYQPKYGSETFEVLAYAVVERLSPYQISCEAGIRPAHVYVAMNRLRKIGLIAPREGSLFEPVRATERGLDFYRRAYFSHWSGQEEPISSAIYEAPVETP